MECMETGEEEEEDSSALELPFANPPATSSSVHSYQHIQYLHIQRARETSPHHMQELETTSQFPMSGDLPSLDPGLPSPSLGFDVSQVYTDCSNY